MNSKHLVIACLALGLFGVLGLGINAILAPSWAHEKAEAPWKGGLPQGPTHARSSQTTEGTSTHLSLPGRKHRPNNVKEDPSEKPREEGETLLRGRLVSLDKGAHRLEDIAIAIHLDGRDYKIKTQANGDFVLHHLHQPNWTSLLFSLPREEFFFPLAGIDLAGSLSYGARLLAKARAGKVLKLPVLPWARLQIQVEGPGGQALEQARLFVRPLASPASLGKDRYRLPGRQVAQDPPLGPGIGENQGRGLYLCEKIPPKMALHLLALGDDLRAEINLPALSPGKTQRIVLRLLPSPSSKKTQLKLLNLKGRLIPTARAWLFDEKEKAFGRLFASPNKSISFYPPLGGGRIRVWAPGFRPRELVMNKGATLPPNLEIRLRRGGKTLRTQITKKGKPLSRIPIHAQEIPHQPWSLSWTHLSDARGIAQFSGLAPTSGILLTFGEGGGSYQALGKNMVPDPPLLERWQWKTVASFSIQQGARIQGNIHGFKGDPRELSLRASYSGVSVKGAWTRNLFNLPLQGKKTKAGFEFTHQGLPRGDYSIRTRTRVLTRFSLRPGEQKLGLTVSY